MIVTGDIGNILYLRCGDFGIARVVRGSNISPDAPPLTEERVVIIVKSQRPETYWRKSFVEVNLCVPDFENGQANLPRLHDLERRAASVFEYGNFVTGNFDGTPYRYSVDTIDGAVEDKQLGCHFVNVRLLFEILNTL